MTGGWRPSRAQQIGTPVLILTLALVGLAGWPAQVRPSVLERPHQIAVYALRALGVSAGQPLFHTDNSVWKQYGYCPLIRARGADGSAEPLFPPQGECRFDGVHWRLPPVDRALHRMLSAAWGAAKQGAARTAESDGYLAAIGRHFCTRAAPRPETVEVVWTWYFRHYETAQITRMNGLEFAYDCGAEALSRVDWHPDDAAVIAFWGAPPWK